MGLFQDNRHLKSAVRCGHINRFMLKITEDLFFFSRYLGCLEYFVWQNAAFGMLSVLYLFFQVLKSCNKVENGIVSVPKVFGEGGKIDTRAIFHSCGMEN